MLIRPPLARPLVVGVIGDLPASRMGAMQGMAKRHDKASGVLAGGDGFEEWSERSRDEVVAAAPTDRLIHWWHVVSLRGDGARVNCHAAR